MSKIIYLCGYFLKSLPHLKSFDLYELKLSVDDNLNLAKTIEYASEQRRKHFGKRRNADY